MNEKICELITELASTGGTTAIWLYGLYVVGGVLKYVIGFGCVLAGIYKACSTWRLLYEANNES